MDERIESIEGAVLDYYKTFLSEPYRPPSKGGNTRALHTHVFYINGEKYSFFALGAKRWVFASDKVSFKYKVTPEGYKNILRESIQVIDKSGVTVERGLRGFKRVLRTAQPRTPGRRRELEG